MSNTMSAQTTTAPGHKIEITQRDATGIYYRVTRLSDGIVVAVSRSWAYEDLNHLTARLSRYYR